MIACRPYPTRFPNYVGWRQAGRCRFDPFGTAHTYNPIGTAGGYCRSVLAPDPGGALSRSRRAFSLSSARRRFLVGGPLAALSRPVHFMGGRTRFEGRYGALIRHLINVGEPRIEIRFLPLDPPHQAPSDVCDVLPGRSASALFRRAVHAQQWHGDRRDGFPRFG